MDRCLQAGGRGRFPGISERPQQRREGARRAPLTATACGQEWRRAGSSSSRPSPRCWPLPGSRPRSRGPLHRSSPPARQHAGASDGALPGGGLPPRLQCASLPDAGRLPGAVGPPACPAAAHRCTLPSLPSPAHALLALGGHGDEFSALLGVKHRSVKEGEAVAPATFGPPSLPRMQHLRRAPALPVHCRSVRSAGRCAGHCAARPGRGSGLCAQGGSGVG